MKREDSVLNKNFNRNSLEYACYSQITKIHTRISLVKNLFQTNLNPEIRVIQMQNSVRFFVFLVHKTISRFPTRKALEVLLLG